MIFNQSNSDDDEFINEEEEEMTKDEIKIIHDKLIFILNENLKTANIAGYESAEGDVFIPKSIKYKNEEFIIKTILKGSFHFSKNIRSIQFSDDSELQKIEKDAFISENIKYISLPSSVCALETGWCNNIYNSTKVTLSSNNPHYKMINGDECIIGKTDENSEIFDTIIFVNRYLKEFTIPSYITRIGPYSFSFCQIEKIIIPSQITHIDSNAFNSSNFESIEFAPDSKLQIIGDHAFFSSFVEKIEIPPSVTKIGKNAFLISEELRNIIIPSNSKLCQIGQNAFSGLIKLTSIILPPHIKRIEKNAFNMCISLQHIEIPSNIELKAIEEFVFSQTAIETIAIPSDIEELHKGWFANADYLKSITIIPKKQKNIICYENDMIIGKKDLNSDEYDVLLYVKSECENCLIPPFIKAISSYAFSLSLLKNIVFPPSVTRICEYAFNKCQYIENIEFPPDSQLQTIEKNAFFSTNIKKISLPANVSEISEGWCCKNFKIKTILLHPNNHHFMIYENKLMIGKSDISSDKYDVILLALPNIRTITIPAFVKRIGEFSFYCSSIKNAYLTPQVTEIGTCAFLECRNLHKFEIPFNSELKIIDKYAFADSSIKSLFIPSSVTQIGERCFYGPNDFKLFEINNDSITNLLIHKSIYKYSNAFVMIPKKHC